MLPEPVLYSYTYDETAIRPEAMDCGMALDPWQAVRRFRKGKTVRAIFAAVMLGVALSFASAGIVMGNGKVDSEIRSVKSFKSVSVEGSGTLRVHKGGQRVQVTCDSNILPYVTTVVHGDELKIKFKPFTAVLKATKLEYEVTMPELTGLRLAGSGDAYIDRFQGERFSSEISGSGGVKLDLDYKSVRLTCSGSGGFDAAVKAERLDLRCSGSVDAFVNGSADKAEVIISGSGTLGAKDFAVKDARVILSGSGQVEIKVAESLDATVSGSGGIKYWGRPAINQRVSGSGRIASAGD
jgi:hypothetical protein